RVPVERWRGHTTQTDDRGDAALRALLVLDPAAADAMLAAARAQGPLRAEQALAIVLERSSDLARIAAFVDVPETRAAALDALAAAAGGATALAALPASEDVDVALALAHPSGEARATLLGRSGSLLVRALAGAVDASECAASGNARAGAACLAIAGA